MNQINHPYRRIHLYCKTCGIPITIEQKNVNPEGNYCRKCILNSVERNGKISKAKMGENHPMFGKHHKKSTLDKMSKRHKEIYQDPAEIDKLRIAKLGKVCSESHRKHVSESKKGDKNPQWKGGVAPKKYCFRFNTPFKERTRAFQGYRCALCGRIWQNGETRLAVHHNHNMKDSCCNEKSPREFICLCPNGCHQKTIGKEDLFAPRFSRYLIKNFNGKCYYTKEEMEEICQKEAMVLNTYAVNKLSCEVK